MISWSDSVGVLKSVGKKRQKILEDMALVTIGDLLFHLPFRYEDWDARLPLWELTDDGLWLVYEGRLQSFSTKAYGPRGRQTLVIAELDGAQGPVEALWFNRPHLVKHMVVGSEVILSGRLRFNRGRQIHVEQHAFYQDGKPPTSKRGLQPIYSTSEGLPQRTLSNLIGQALKELIPALEAPFPAALVKELALVPFKHALQGIHYPEKLEKVEVYRQSLAAFEFFSVLYWAQVSNSFTQQGQVLAGDGGLRKSFRASLPYELTASQEKVLEEIHADMASPQQMHRLLQGDVGSGKTSVAVLALLQAVEAGSQGVLMAPTEVLARQHFKKMQAPLDQLGLRCQLLTGQIKGKAREEVLADLASGDASLVVGTHALLEEDVHFKRLGLVIIDEQHRFGVRQRQVLLDRHDHPDLLVMTATPIPRSLALTLYGHLNLSVIDSKPVGRGEVQTIFMRESKRGDMNNFIRKELEQGRQAYVVTPLIESSEKMDLQDAESLYIELSQHSFPNHQLALLHGRMSAAEKEAVMEDFRKGSIDLLVSTTVIEVGIDVANATLMVIENAERFGLSQLHQLRGRVGRGKHKSYCILISNTESKDALERLQTFVYAKDGFAIAEADLKQRGAGELMGFRQHGQALFKIADPATDWQALEQAQGLNKEREHLHDAWAHRILADMARKTTL